MKNLKCVIRATLLTSVVILGLCILAFVGAILLGVVAYYFSIMIKQYLLFSHVLIGTGFITVFIIIWHELYMKYYNKYSEKETGEIK